MKKNLFLALSIAVLVSCSPQILQMGVQTREPSISGLDLGNKSLAVAYIETPHDTAFSKALASCFAEELDKSYFDGKETVEIFAADAPLVIDKAYVSRLIMDTDSDVVFLFDAPVFTDDVKIVEDNGKNIMNVPCKLTIYAYDALDKADTLRTFQTNYLIQHEYGNTAFLFDDILPTHASEISGNAAKRFQARWKNRDIYIYYYDELGSLWDEATEAAYNFDFMTAMTKWMKLVDSKDRLKRACAEYNVALSCLMLGDKELATKWLTQADADYSLEASPHLWQLIREL